MSTSISTAAPETPAAATPDTIVEQLRTIRQQIPEYTQLAIPDAKAIRRIAHINSDFVDAAINAVGASEVVQTAVGRSDANLREENEDAGRWTAVEDELRAMLKGVVAANLVRRHRVGPGCFADVQHQPPVDSPEGTLESSAARSGDEAPEQVRPQAEDRAGRASAATRSAAARVASKPVQPDASERPADLPVRGMRWRAPRRQRLLRADRV